MSEANLCMTYVRGWRVVVEIIDLFLYVSQMINHRDRKLKDLFSFELWQRIFIKIIKTRMLLDRYLNS